MKILDSLKYYDYHNITNKPFNDKIRFVMNHLSLMFGGGIFCIKLSKYQIGTAFFGNMKIRKQYLLSFRLSLYIIRIGQFILCFALHSMISNRGVNGIHWKLRCLRRI